MNISHDEIHPYYVMQYIVSKLVNCRWKIYRKFQGHNICEDNGTDLERKQSMNYYVSIDSNSVIFAKLVPYTHYTLIFTDPVYGKSITQKPHTIPSGDSVMKSSRFKKKLTNCYFLRFAHTKRASKKYIGRR